MRKSLSRLWLKSVKRIGKAQQTQGRKLLKSLLPKAAKAVRAPSVRAPSVKRPGASKSRSRVAAGATSGALTGLPGVWKMAYFALAPGQVSSPRRLQYWLYLPGTAQAGSADARALLPMVVMLHGCQQSATDFAVATRMNQLAERKGFAVLYPQQSATADPHRCWHWYKKSTQLGQGDVQRIGLMIEQVQARYGLDRSRTYVAGLSAGAGLAALVALHYSKMIAAVGLHSGPVVGTSESAASAFRIMQRGSGPAHIEAALNFAKSLPAPVMACGIPAILIHGKRDAVVRPVNVAQLTQQFQILNSAAITGPEPVQRDFPARATGRSPSHAYKTVTYYAGRKPQLLRCEIASLGHAWSGGTAQVAFSAPEGPDASLLMWNFFALHRRLPASSQVEQTLQ